MLYSTRLTVPKPFYFEERNQRTAEKKKRLQQESLCEEEKVSTNNKHFVLNPIDVLVVDIISLAFCLVIKMYMIRVKM